ncbi:sugar porter family MFS transporter [Ereboglobus luteus]|uniref:MFS transporter n=1 Tax=Ereboglobus luteus TaxID=1796921 RepID=A0A2U8E5R9_9BACT|nr:sugar porter family MFS transporter [Ereboglobus luteus]AWI10105.1 MFS transporter [Ereboglobus luteus]
MNANVPAGSAVPAPKTGYNLAYVWCISIVVALGGLLFGYDWVVIGGAKPFFERYFQLDNPALSGWANSCALIGCLVGVMVAGMLSDRFGRKRLLMTAALTFAITSIGNALAPNFTLFIIWRMLGGVAIGLASNLSPLYIAEVAPAHLRGRLVSVNQLTIVIGILLAQFINWFLVRNLPEGATNEWIVNSWFGQQGWRWMFGLTAVPSVLFIIGMFFVPESPRWLVTKGRVDDAAKILGKIGGAAYAQTAIGEINQTITTTREKINFRELLDPRLRGVLILGITLAVFQQWCGINVIFNYAEDIFSAAGYDISTVLKNIAWTGSVNLAFTFVALGTVDKGGRRPLMLFGAAGLALIYTAMGFCYFTGVQGWPMLLLVLAAIGCYAMSLGPVTWVVISEVFPNRIRGAAMAVAVAALWGACFVLTYTFPLLNNALGAYGTFWLYAAICIAGFIFIKIKLPETKGKTLEQLEKELVD